MIGAHTILAPLLARALNRYLDGVNSDTLRIALLRRKLSLRNVSVNCDALNRELNLGIKLTRVRIETIDVHYAVFGKREETLRVRVEGVDVEAEAPNDDEEDEDDSGDGVDSDALRERRDAREKAMEHIASAMETHAREMVKGSAWSNAWFAAAFERLSVECRRASATYATKATGSGREGDVGRLRGSIERFTMKSVGKTSSARSAEDDEDANDGEPERKKTKTSEHDDDAGDASFSGDAMKRVEITGLSLIVDDGETSGQHDVVGPNGRVRMDVHLRKRARRARFLRPKASKYVAKIDVRDVLETNISASQAQMLLLVRDEIDMWTKRRAHGERRPKTKNPVDWWRYAVRATVPRGEHHRARMLDRLRHGRSQLEAYVEVCVERKRGQRITMPEHLQKFETRLTADDVELITSLVERKVASLQETEDDMMDSMFPSYHSSYSAADIFDTSGDDAEETAEQIRRMPESKQTSTSLTSYLYAKSTSYISKAYNYVNVSSKYASASESVGDFEPEVSVEIPGVSMTIRDAAENRLRFTANNISLAHGALFADDEGVVSETQIHVDRVHAEDSSSGVAEDMIWSRETDGERAVTIKLNPSACATLDVLVNVHVKMAPHGMAIRPSTAKVLAGFASIRDGPYGQALRRATLGLNNRSPECRLKMIKLLGDGIQAIPVLVEIDSPLLVVPAQTAPPSIDVETSAALAFGAEKIVFCQENGSRSRDDGSFDRLVDEASAMMDYAYDANEAWRALEELSEFVLQTRSFAHVDGAWMTAANASAAIAEGVKLTVVNDATIFDSDVTMVDLEPIELNFDPVSVAAVVHVVQAFADVSVQTTASSTPFAVDSGLRFNLEKIALNLNSASGRMHYTVTDISIATKGSSDDWRMKSSVGTVSGVHMDADSAQTEIVRCSPKDSILKAHVCARIAGTIELGAIDVRVTQNVLETLSEFARLTKDVKKFFGERLHVASPIQSRSVRGEFDRAWSCVATFDIADSLSLFLHGSIEPMSFKLFEESGEKEAVALTTRAMEIRGNASHVELELPRMLLSILNAEFSTSLLDVEDVHFTHSFGSASNAAKVQVGSIGAEITPTDVRRLVVVSESIPKMPSLTKSSPIASPGITDANVFSIPSVDVNVKRIRLSAREADEISLTFFDVTGRASPREDGHLAELRVDSIDLQVCTRKSIEHPTTLLHISSESGAAVKMDAMYAQGSVKSELLIGKGDVEFNAPYIIAGTSVLHGVRQAMPVLTASTTTSAPSISPLSLTLVSANFRTETWTVQLPWRSESERHAPLRIVRLKTRQSGTLNEFTAGSCVDATFTLDEFTLETGYCKDEDDLEGSSIMFTLAEVIGLSSRMTLPPTSPEHFARKVVPKMDVTVHEMRARANEVSLHLIQEVSALILAQPATLNAIEAYDQLPSSSSPHEFDLSINVESMSACLEHAQVHIVVPVLQVMMTDARVDVKSSSSGVDGSASMDVEMDYLHPVKAAWEPILEPMRVSTSIKLTPEFLFESVNINVAAGIEITMSHSVVEALLKTQIIAQAAQAPIADLEQSTTFGPCTYQMTNATGFNVAYALTLVRGGEITSAGAGKTIAGDTNVMHFERREENRACKTNRVIERGASYWASPINDDDEDDGASVRHRSESTQERVPHVSLEFEDIQVDIDEAISLDTIGEETSLLEYEAQMVDGSCARVIAEIGPCSNKVNRYELLLRSDVAILNGTNAPIVMCFQQSATLPATIFGPILPGESVWLPIPLRLAKNVQWRVVSPDEDFGEISVDEVDDSEASAGSPFLSPLHRSKTNATPRSPFGDAFWRRRHNWSTFVAFSDLVAKEDAIEASLCSVTKEHSIASSDPYTCAFTVTRDETLKRVQLALSAPLKFVNTLPLQMVVTCRARNAFGHDARIESHVVNPGESTLFTASHPTWSASVSAQIVGYAPCEELVVPEYTMALKNAKCQANGEIYHVDRDTKRIHDGGDKSSSQAVSLRFTFYIDEATQSRTLYCAAPLVVLNSTSCAIVLEDMLYGTEMEESVQSEIEVFESNPDAERQGTNSPLPNRLFIEDAENFETPPAPASPFARLAQNQALPSLRRMSSSTNVLSQTSPLLMRQSSLRLNADSVTLLTPSTPGRQTVSTDHGVDYGVDDEDSLDQRATVLGSSAHWRKSIKRRPRIRIRLKSSSAWSRPFRIDPTGLPIEIRLPSDAGSDVCEHVFVVTASMVSTDKLCKTAKIMIRPKFLIKSTLDEAVWIRHGGTESVDLLQPRSATPLRWFDMRSKVPKVIMFRPEKGVFEWSKPVHVPEHTASILKMRHLGGDSTLHTETITVSILENDDGTFDIRIARPTEIDGALGMHSIENHSNASIWYHQLGADDARVTLAPKESEERLIEDSSLPRALVIGYGDLSLGEPISLDITRTLSYSVVTTDKRCLRVMVTREGPMCSVIIEDALSSRVADTPERPRLSTKTPQRPGAPVNVSFKCGWIGVSAIHGHEELLYGRVSGITVKVLADGSEFKSAVRVHSARVDHTSSKAKRPIVLAIPERHQSAREALELHVHGWVQKLNGLPVIRSLKVDLAPAFVDLHDELIESVPRAIAPCVRHAELLLPPAKPTIKANGARKRSLEGETVGALTSVYLQELIINDVELVLSFSRLPGLPVAVRALAGVDRANLRLRGFHMNQPSLMAADVSMMAARHFAREAVIVAGSLWAHNSLLGDPRRLWDEIIEAFDEMHQGSATTALPRVIMALTAAFAHSGETALSQARDVVDGWLEALEVAQASRRFSLRPRRLGTVEDLEKQATVTFVARIFDTVGRVVFDVIDGPLHGLELAGVRGLVEGSVIGLMSALTRVLAAALDGAELSARRLRLFTAAKTFEGEYMRPRRPLPTSYMDPIRPYHLIEAIGRETLAKLASSEKRERFVAAASLMWPSHDMCVLTGGKLLVVHRSDVNAPYVRSSVRFVDISGVLRDGNRVSVYAARAERSTRVSLAQTQSVFARAYGFAFGWMHREQDQSFHDVDETFRGEDAATPTSIVVRCADEDAARWLSSALSPFVNANAKQN